MQKIMFNDKYGLTQAVLEGRKTMTRRVVGNFAPIVSDVRLNERGCAEERHGDVWFPAGKKKNPKYKVGEVVAVAQRYSEIMIPISGETRIYNEGLDLYQSKLEHEPGWTNKMFVKADLMPNRIRITDVRIERLQDISDEDCIREGINAIEIGYGRIQFVYDFKGCKMAYETPREAFAALIDKVSGKGTWESNPWVYVYEFEKVK